ncbi:MAG TPA: hypothetical protein VJ739_02765, partial [Gemmataceae bacterium]|nr:hypothetical protein [Gemmataceae bacterium]
WEQFGTDTDDPSARADTGPNTPARLAARSRARAAQKRLRPWWEVALVGMMIVAAVAAAVIYLLTWIFGRPNAAAVPTAPELRTLFVNKAGGGPDTYPSLQVALRKARTGEHVVIQEALLEEVVHVEHNTVARGVTVEGEPGKPVVWRARNGADAAALLSVEGVEDLHVRNLTLDGGGAAEKLVLLTGRCPGLTLEGLELRGFKGCGVLVMQCEGAADRPIVFEGLRLTAQEAEAGLLFQLAKDPDKYPVKANRFFQIDGCRFTGHYTARPVAARPPVKTLFMPDGNVQVVGDKEIPVPQP